MTSIGSLQLRIPLLNAAGPATCGDDFDQWVHIGAFVTQSLTLTPRAGNPGERLFDAQAGLINAVGLDNPGIDAFLLRKLPRLLTKGVPVIASITGERPEDFISLARALTGSGVSAIELNISCPNNGGYPAENARELGLLVEGVVDNTLLPVIVKLSALMPVVDYARRVEAAGADAIALSNTLPARSHNGQDGGLSGPAIFHIALRAVADVSRVTQLPVIGIGGISRHQDVTAMLEAGASAVGIGTAWLHEPQVFERLVRHLAE